MNILDIQDKLKGLSESQLAQEMQMPSGSVPQFLVLGEMNRRQSMRQSMQQQGAGAQTVAQELLNGAGVPSEGMSGMARAMAPRSSIAQNTGISALPQEAPPSDQGGIEALAPKGMYAGGPVVKMATGAFVPRSLAMPQRSGPTPFDVFNMQEYFRSNPEADQTALPEETEDQTVAATLPVAASGSSGASASSPTSTYEQMLQDAMANAEKKAKQDKWLALAQAGMSLMSSTQPNLAGALGEAGAAGIEALKSARDTSEATRLQLAKEQFAIDQNRAALARSAASAGKPKPRTASSILSDISTIDEIISKASKVDPLTGEAPPMSDAETATIAQLMEQRDALINQYSQLQASGVDLSDPSQ